MHNCESLNFAENKTMTYKEVLPDQCPPSNADESNLNKVCRFLLFPDNDERNFHSHKKLGKKIGDACECRAASVSLFKHDCIPSVLSASKTALFKNKKICLLEIPAGSGRHIEKKGHIDFWMYSEYDPKTSIVAILENADELSEAVEND